MTLMTFLNEKKITDNTCEQERERGETERARQRDRGEESGTRERNGPTLTLSSTNDGSSLGIKANMAEISD